MDPVKGRKKAQGDSADRSQPPTGAPSRATGAPTGAPTSAPSKRKRRTTVAPRPVDDEEDIEAMRDRAIVDPPDVPERGFEREEVVRLDPLQEFLAVYDDGDLAHVVDFGASSADLDDEKRFLSFDLAGEAYAASIMDIREILKFVSLTEVPRAPREVLGVLSKRGIVMPVVDLGAILGLRAPERRVERDQRVLVAGEGERVCGLRVDRVHEVVRLAQKGIEDVPASLGTKNAHMLIGLGRAASEGGGPPRILILLDVPAVLAHFSEAMGIAAAPTREAS